jgi:hypothetical protein
MNILKELLASWASAGKGEMMILCKRTSRTRKTNKVGIRDRGIDWRKHVMCDHVSDVLHTDVS